MNTHLHGRELLAQLSNVERVEHSHESECCGFGGTFSVRMPDISGAMVADKTRALKESGAHQVLSADCGCLMNINGALEKQMKRCAANIWPAFCGNVPEVRNEHFHDYSYGRRRRRFPHPGSRRLG
jgi:Fe-S oxidoreductase